MKTKLLLILALISAGIAQAMEPQPLTINEVPDEILVHVLSYVIGRPAELQRKNFESMKKELCCFAATSKRFRALTYEPSLHRGLAKFVTEKDSTPQATSNQDTEESFLKRGRVWEKYLRIFSLQAYGYYLKPPAADETKGKENTPSPTLNIKKAHRATKLRKLDHSSSRQARFEQDMEQVRNAFE